MNSNDERLLAGAELIRRWVIERPQPVIQVRNRNGGEWSSMSDEAIPAWYFSGYDYREKPVPREWYLVRSPETDGLVVFSRLPEHGTPDWQKALRSAIHVREIE